MFFSLWQEDDPPLEIDPCSMRIVIRFRTGKLSLDPLPITFLGQVLMPRIEYLDQFVPAHGATPSLH